MVNIKSETDKAKAVGHIVSGLYIVCAQDEKTGKACGFLASWIQQVSFDPLLISMAIKPSRPGYSHITGGQVFTINVVGDHDDTCLKDFCKGYDPEFSPFNKLQLIQGEAGGIILASSRSAMECLCRERHTPGDHDLVIAEVLNSYILSANSMSRVHFRETGRTY